MRNYTFRLTPGQDLYNSIDMFARDMGIEAGCVLSGVGSLTQFTLRFANQEIHNKAQSILRSCRLQVRCRSMGLTFTSQFPMAGEDNRRTFGSGLYDLYHRLDRASYI